MREGNPNWLLKKPNVSEQGVRNLLENHFARESLCQRSDEPLAAADESASPMEEALRQCRQAENTLVVFPSDNGLLLGEQGLADKRAMHEPSFRILMPAAWPKLIPSGVARQEPVLNSDRHPHAARRCGSPRPGHTARLVAPHLHEPKPVPAIVIYLRVLLGLGGSAYSRRARTANR